MKNIDIVYKSIDEIKPYERNARKNDKAVEQVARSIDLFGFKVPIVVTTEGVIIAGHTRFKAAKKRGINKIPCIVADDLSEDEIKAFRLVDNKVAEKASWDFDMLREELEDLVTVDVGCFDFKLPEIKEPAYYGAEREKTFNHYNLYEFDMYAAAGRWQMPELHPCYAMPDDLIGFNYVLSSKEFDKGIHFYVDDYQFERVWNRPDFYIEKISRFRAALTPDFSLYADMPMAMKIWNVYRSRLIGQMMQRQGIDVIPTVSWAEEETFDFCFDGLPEGSVLSISTIGVKRDKEAMKVWKAGVDEMIKRCKPKALVVYGGEVEYDYGDVDVKYYDNQTTKRMAGSK